MGWISASAGVLSAREHRRFPALREELDQAILRAQHEAKAIVLWLVAQSATKASRTKK